MTQFASESSTGVAESMRSVEKFSRRVLLRRAVAYSALPVLGGTYATCVEPFWPVYHELAVSVRHLPPRFDGCRIAQLSDLHVGETPLSFIRRVCTKVRALQPDVVVLTGDITHHDIDSVEPTCRMLAEVFAGIPLIVTFGNHEYGVHRGDGSEFADLPVLMDDALRRRGLSLLRNQSMALDRAGEKLWFAGLDDFWFGNWDPDASFRDIPAGAATIALTHNPDTADAVDAHGPSLILCGHTHGGQVRLPGLGAIYLNTINRRYDQGSFALHHSTLYVSRGVGYIRPLRFCCRPEVPIFRLECAM